LIKVYLLEEGEDPEGTTSLGRGGMSYDEYSRRFMVGTPEEISERLQPMAEAGVDYFLIYLPRVAYNPAPVKHFAKEVIPNFA
jgi:alkanesulfonate monooxygenase SsuD/methylene tetrahydromethanopterin reductase-like flavin-dependent oxidoreductase (luciferase family)